MANERDEPQQQALEVRGTQTVMEVTERVTRVEMQVQSVVIEQNRMQTVIERQSTIIETLAARQQQADLIAAAIRERTDQHSKTIEHLQESEADVSNILEGMKTQMGIIRTVGMAILTIIIGYLFSHFIH